MENSKQELLVQSLATSSGATVARDLGLFNGELVVIRKLLSRYNPAGERGGTLTTGGSRRGQTRAQNITISLARISLVTRLCANSRSIQFNTLN